MTGELQAWLRGVYVNRWRCLHLTVQSRQDFLSNDYVLVCLACRRQARVPLEKLHTFRNSRMPFSIVHQGGLKELLWT